MPKDSKSPSLSSQPVIEFSDEYYEVETILDRRLSPNGMLYLIRWKNYPDPKDYTWEPLQHLNEVKQLVQEFNTTFQEKKVNLKSQVSPRPETKPTQSVSVKQFEQKQSDCDQEPQNIPKAPIVGKRGRKKGGQNKTKNQQIKKTVKKVSSSEQEIQQSEEEDIKIRPRRLMKGTEINTTKEIQKKNSVLKNELSKGKKFKIDDKFKLGRICNHFCQQGEIYFKVNLLNKNEMLSNMVVISHLDLQERNKESIRSYLQGHFKQILMNQSEEQTVQYKDMQDYWRNST